MRTTSQIARIATVEIFTLRCALVTQQCGALGQFAESMSMQQLVYALRFQGFAKRVGADGNVLQSETMARGCIIDSRIGAGILSGSVVVGSGDAAVFNLELTFTGPTTFQEVGTIDFERGGHRLYISTVGSGHLGLPHKAAGRHGAAILGIVGGEGQFAGSSGLIVSNFVVSDEGELTDHHLGLILFAEGGNHESA
jgi:hypothetical protein